MNIPYGKQHIDKKDIKAVIKALKSNYLTQGPKVLEFEKEFAKYVGSNYAVTVSNATAGLHISMLALNLKKGDRVLTTPITFAATGNCIRYVSGEVWFADINPETYTLCLNSVKKLIESKPKGFFKGIIPVDFAGLPVDLEKFRILADKYNLWIVEDACHAPGGYFEDSKNIKQFCGNGVYSDISVNELKKEFPELTDSELEEIQQQGIYNDGYSNRSSYERTHLDKNIIQVLYFNYKTYANEVYKVKETSTGATKMLQKDDSFNVPQGEDRFARVSNALEVLYEGALVLGSKKLLKWNLAKNMVRPKSDYTKVKMNYSIVAPRMYKGKIESLVSRITGFADTIQLTHLKLQQVMSRMVPDGVYLDADGLAEVDLGNGTNYNPQEALNMFFQTGSVIGRSLTSEGDMNPGKVPIQEISSGSGGAKLQSLIGTYNYYLQMIRDVTGLNEARDGSVPDKNALVGVQKLAAANSNTATRHILQSGLFLTSELAESLSLRISDIIEYAPTKEAFIQAIGAHNVATLDEMSNLHLYDFGIFIELTPDEEEKALLENNIQVALAQQNIELEDAIDLREIKNIKLANQLLKIRRQQKLERDQAIAQQNIQAQAQANMQTQQAAAQLEVQKNQAKMQAEAQLEQMKAQMKAEGLKRQILLVPEMVELTPHAVEILLQYTADLKQLGLLIEKVGDKNIVIREVPAILGEIDAAQLIRDLSDEIESLGSPMSLKEKIDEVLATMACHGSVRHGKRMSYDEMNQLLRDMEATPYSGQCNHGRPTYVELDKTKIETPEKYDKNNGKIIKLPIK